MELNLNYRSISDKEEVAGEGKTLNVSSGGILFYSEIPLQVGDTLEVTVDWPAKIAGVCPMKLLLKGRVVRVSGKHAAFKVAQYEFRTRGLRRPEALESSLGNNHHAG